MKKSLYVLIAIALLLSHCDKHDNISGNNNNDGNNNGIRIRGKITGLAKRTDDVTLRDAKKVLLYSQNYYRLVNIVADTFSVPAQFRTGIALIFLDANNKYIGNLSVRGFNMLPLGNLINREFTTIDLSTLQLIGSTVVPSRDPFGNEIQISDAELQTLRVADGYFESIAKNIDADNDDVPDVLSDKQLVFITHFNFHGGHWGHNDTLPVPIDSSDRFVEYGLEVEAGAAQSFYAANISLAGPSHDPSPDIKLWGFLKAPGCGGNRGFIASFNRWDRSGTTIGSISYNNFLRFQQGTYTLTLDWTKKFTLDYSSVDMKYNLIIIIPTLHTDELSRLTSITFQYKLPDGTPFNPSSVLSSVMVQLSSGTISMLDARINTSAGSADFTTLKMDVPVDISNMTSILIAYNDLMGNFYGINWR